MSEAAIPVKDATGNLREIASATVSNRYYQKIISTFPVGTYAYGAVSSVSGGTVSVPAGAKFMSWRAFAKDNDGTVSVAGGASITLAKGTGMERDLRELELPGQIDVVFGAGVEGFVDWTVA